MNQHWVELQVEYIAQVIFVLDVSESAERAWPAIAALLRRLGDELPVRLERRLFFLGSPEEYPFEQFDAAGAEWRRRNRGRGSFLTPLFERLETEEEAAILVIGSGRLFDLDDWVGTPLLGRARFVRAGDASLTGGICEEESPDAERLRQGFENPVVRIQIALPQGMPFAWDNPAYRLEGTALVAGEGASLSTRAAFLAAGDAPPSARATLADGSEKLLPLKTIDPWMPAHAWQDLTPLEAEAFRRCVRGEAYRCPRCGGRHEAEQLHCGTNGAAPLIFSSLEGLRGMVLLRDFGAAVKYHLHPCAALRLHDDVVAVNADGQVELYSLDPAGRRWRRTGRPLPPFYWLGDRTHALVL
jgi:hypothetical protein